MPSAVAVDPKKSVSPSTSKVGKIKADKHKKEKKEKKLKEKKDKKEKKSKKRSSSSNSGDDSQTTKKAKASPAEVTIAEAKKFYEENSISVTGDDSFMPYLNFSNAPFGSDILQACAKFDKPTPIQAACWPVICADRDVIGIAETGSGKTFAFTLPALNYLKNTFGSKVQKCKKPYVLIVSPTRELAIQTHEQVEVAGKLLGIQSVCLYGGSPKFEQKKMLKNQKPAVIVATPGRLIDLIETDQALDLSDVSFLVLDEADRMLDQGFERDIRKIIGMARQGTDRHTVMFSATWPQTVRKLADDFLIRPVRVSIGSDELAVNERVEQIVEVIDPDRKERRLTELLQKYHKSRKNRILIFALYKKEAARIEMTLRRQGYNCIGIHGDKAQAQRLQAIESFRDGSVPLLIATDVAARGLDVPDVEYVINYTFPLTIDEFTHRCGRTARAGKTGVAHTFFTLHDKAHSGELINTLKAANMPVPDNLLKFGTTVKKKQHSAYGAFFKDVDEAAKPTKIVFD